MQGYTYEKSYKKTNLIYIKLRKNYRWIIITSLKIKHT